MGQKIQVKEAVEVELDAASAVDPIQVFRKAPPNPFGAGPNKEGAHAVVLVSLSDGSQRSVTVSAADTLGKDAEALDDLLDRLRLAAAQKLAAG